MVKEGGKEGFTKEVGVMLFRVSGLLLLLLLIRRRWLRRWLLRRPGAWYMMGG